MLLILIVACGSQITTPSQSLPFPIYRDWWAEAEACTRISAPLERVSWQFVESFSDPKVAARWSTPHEITVLRFYAESRRVVQHEMIHDLLQAGDEAHGHRCFSTI